MERTTSWWLTVGGGTSDFSLFELRSETGGSTRASTARPLTTTSCSAATMLPALAGQPRLEGVCDREIDI